MMYIKVEIMDRERLTITLKKEILKKLDNCIDGARIRNRSHAIEYVLARYFAPKLRRALILAGGKGIKMRPFTYEMPKCLIPVNGRPVLDYIIENLRRYDIRDIILSIGHHGEKIREYMGDGSRYGVTITYVEQKGLEIGTAVPIRQAKKLLGTEPFVLYYADVLAKINYDDMFDFHIANNGVATMALTSVSKSSDWGVVRVQGSKIYSFLEKPDHRKDLSKIINVGITLCEPSMFEYVTPHARRLEKDVFPRLAQERKLAGYLFAGQWFDVGNPESYKQAVEEWKV